MPMPFYVVITITGSIPLLVNYYSLRYHQRSSHCFCIKKNKSRYQI